MPGVHVAVPHAIPSLDHGSGGAPEDDDEVDEEEDDDDDEEEEALGDGAGSSGVGAFDASFRGAGIP